MAAEVIRLAREFRAALLADEDAQMAAMARRYLALEHALEAEVESVTAYLDALRAAGVTPTAAQLYREARIQRLLTHLDSEYARYSSWAGDMISGHQIDYTKRALGNAIDALSAAAHDAGTYASFDRLPVSAFETMAGYASDGTPLAKLIAEGYPKMAQQILSALVTGVGRGSNPKVVARAISKAYGVGLNRAMLIARTEQLRAYRTATMATYREYGVKFFQRIGAQDDRECLACSALEGEILATELELDDHPAGRCGVVPVLDPAAPPELPTGEAWFSAQDESTQLAMAGPTRLEMWRSGQVAFKDFATHTQDARWGGSVQLTTISELTGGTPAALREAA